MLILELTNKECVETLTRLRIGRLGCSRDNQPYIVPIYFAYHERHLYSFAALGQKIEWMRANPLVCVEADEIIDHYHWTSVIVQGRYEELPDTPEWGLERESAYALLQRQAMWWEPAYVKAPHPVAAEQVIPMYYRIHIDQVTGRRARPDPIEAVALLEPATTPRREGWLKSLLHRTRLLSRVEGDPSGGGTRDSLSSRRSEQAAGREGRSRALFHRVRRASRWQPSDAGHPNGHREHR